MTKENAMLLVWEMSRDEHRTLREMLRVATGIEAGFAMSGFGCIPEGGEECRSHVEILRMWADALEEHQRRAALAVNHEG